MALCNHPREWKLRLEEVQTLFMKQIKEKEKEALIQEQDRLAALEGDESESSVDWDNWAIIRKGLRGNKCDWTQYLGEKED